MEHDTDYWLVLIFGEALKIGFAANAMEDTFRVDATVYRSTDPNYLTAFVDRLIDDDGHLVGFFISPISPSCQTLVASVLPRRYLRLVGGGLEVWISEAPIDGAQNAGDQAFGGRVFAGDSEEWAMSIAAEGLLSQSDVEIIALANAQHVTIR